MKRERGSASVLALIMLLFLAFAGGSWVMMLAHENATALSDEKEQQAWYAAEAGMKRAKIELEAKNSDWYWLTSAEKFSKDNFDYQKVNNNQNDSYAQYGVFIAPSGSTSLISGAPTTGTAYDITSVGEYMGTTKVIKDTFTPLPSGGGGAHGDTDLVEKESKPSIPGDGLTVAGGTVTIKQSVPALEGQIYTEDGTLKKDSIWSPGTESQVSSSADIELYTKIADSVFNESTYGTFTEVSSIAHDQHDQIYNIPSDSLIKFNWPLSVEGYPYFGHQFVSGTNATVYFNLLGSNVDKGNTIWCDGKAVNISSYYEVYTETGIVGPTSGKPLTLIFNHDVYLNSDISGNVRIICKGNIIIEERSAVPSTSKLMILANGNVYNKINVKDCLTFISSDGDVTISNSATGFKGQIQAAGDVVLYTASYYNNWAQNDPDFKLPTMELHGS